MSAKIHKRTVATTFSVFFFCAMENCAGLNLLVKINPSRFDDGYRQDEDEHAQYDRRS